MKVILDFSYQHSYNAPRKMKIKTSSIYLSQVGYIMGQERGNDFSLCGLPSSFIGYKSRSMECVNFLSQLHFMV